MFTRKHVFLSFVGYVESFSEDHEEPGNKHVKGCILGSVARDWLLDLYMQMSLLLGWPMTEMIQEWIDDVSLKPLDAGGSEA